MLLTKNLLSRRNRSGPVLVSKEKSRHFVVIASSNVHIGGGHVSRQIAIAEEAISRGFHVSFVGQISRSATLVIRSLPAQITALCSAGDWPDHAEALRYLHAEDPISVLVVDNYELASRASNWAKDIGQIVLTCFEDGQPLASHADLIVNSGVSDLVFPWVRESLAERSRESVFGVEAAIIRSELFKVRDIRASEHPRLKDPPIGYINFGQSETSAIEQEFISRWTTARIEFPFELHLVSNSAMNQTPREKLLVLPAGISGPLGHESFLDILTRASAAVGAAGVSAYERAFLGIPSINCPVSANQFGISSILESSGSAITLDLSGAPDNHMTRSVFAELASEEARLRMSEKARNFVDGLGAKRVMEKISKLLET